MRAPFGGPVRDWGVLWGRRHSRDAAV